MPKLSPVSYKRLVKVFEAEGFRCVRTEGDHMVFTKPGVIRPVVIPKYAAVPCSSSRTTFGQAGCPATATSNCSGSEPGLHSLKFPILRRISLFNTIVYMVLEEGVEPS
jgi:predicted RNA binding protein YcfA (HicA-like mRNA interferase family)